MGGAGLFCCWWRGERAVGDGFVVGRRARVALLRMTWLSMAAVYERAFAEQRDLMLWERLEHRK